jgi:two-component system, chemotaxis family, chemotaxis protein CheY
MLKVLIVDDTRSVHFFVKGLLGALIIEYQDAFDGEEALQKLRALQPGQAPDLILLDWEMPKLDGPGTLEAIRRNGINIPVIMMTTKNRPEEIARMLEAGASEYLMKPFTKDILLEKIEAVAGTEALNAA